MSATSTPDIHRATMTNGKQTAFESICCTRCGGSGHYSWNAMTGSRCFKCNGQGVTLTKRGAAAAERYRELLSKRVDELQPGDKILDQGCPQISAGGWRVVISVDRAADLAARGERLSSSIYTLDQMDKIERAIDNGATLIPTTYRDQPAFSVYDGYVINCENYGMSGVSADKLVRVARSSEFKRDALAQAREFELTLTKTGKPRSR